MKVKSVHYLDGVLLVDRNELVGKQVKLQDFYTTIDFGENNVILTYKYETHENGIMYYNYSVWDTPVVQKEYSRKFNTKPTKT